MADAATGPSLAQVSLPRLQLSPAPAPGSGGTGLVGTRTSPLCSQYWAHQSPEQPWGSQAQGEQFIPPLAAQGRAGMGPGLGEDS